MSASSDLQVRIGALLDRLVNSGCVVTTAHNGRIDGCFATLATGSSLQPARLLVLMSHENLTHVLIELSRVLASIPYRWRKSTGWRILASSRAGMWINSRGLPGSPVLL